MQVLILVNVNTMSTNFQIWKSLYSLGLFHFIVPFIYTRKIKGNLFLSAHDTDIGGTTPRLHADPGISVMCYIAAGTHKTTQAA